MKVRKLDLSSQLLLLTIIIFGIIFIILGLYIPNILTPIYENNIHYILEEPLKLVKQDVNTNNYGTDIAFLYIVDKQIFYSSNIYDLVPLSINEIINKIEHTDGKFTYKNNQYYYSTSI